MNGKRIKLALHVLIDSHPKKWKKLWNCIFTIIQLFEKPPSFRVYSNVSTNSTTSDAKNPENESWKTVHHIQLQTNSGLHMKVEKCLNEFEKLRIKLFEILIRICTLYKFTIFGFELNITEIWFYSILELFTIWLNR